MKIGIIVPSLSLDPLVSTPTVHLLCRQLTQHVDLHVYPLRYPPAGERFQDSGFTVHPVGGPGVRVRTMMANAMRSIVAEHRRGHFDLLHGLWLHEPGTTAWLVARMLRIPVLVSIGGAEVVRIPDIAYGTRMTRRGRIITGEVLRHVNLVTGGSRYVLDHARPLAGRARSNRLRLAPLPVDTDLFQPAIARQFNPDAPNLLHAASLIPVKDQSTLLYAFARIRHDIPGARLTVIGEDPFDYRVALERITSELGIARSVTFAGAVPHHQMPEVYQQADLFMLSSRHESQGMVVLEAAACGVPVVGTAVGAIPDLFESGAKAVPTSNPDALAEAAIALLRAPELLSASAEQLRERVVADYAAKPATSRFMRLYAELAERQT